jgi:hypothetical protein
MRIEDLQVGQTVFVVEIPVLFRYNACRGKIKSIDITNNIVDVDLICYVKNWGAEVGNLNYTRQYTAQQIYETMQEAVKNTLPGCIDSPEPLPIGG